jgi:hypothetical protein
VYDRKLTEASKGALLELCMALSDYRNDFVLAGGWASYFLSRNYFDHCGSIDIDFVLKPKVMRRYESIKEIVLRLGYKETSNPFRFNRKIKSSDGAQDFDMGLDFLTEPEMEVLERVVDVQEDLRAFLIRGSSIVFDFNYPENLSAKLPAGGSASTTLDVANVVSSIVMKGLALLRLKDKDSYDIYAVAGFHTGSPKGAADAFRNAIRSQGRNSSTIVSEALANIRNAFESPTSYGCVAAARFTGSDGVRIDAHQRVTTFLDEAST